MKKEQKAFGALGSSVFDNARRESWLAKTVPEYENTRLAQEGATARTSAMQAGQTEREIMKQEQKKAELKQKDFQFREEYRFKREELDSEGQQELDLVAANLGKETALKKMEIDAESARDNRLGQDKLTFEIAKYGMEAQLADRKGNESLREGLLTLQQEAINKANEYKKPEDRIENLNVPAANAPFTPSPAVAAPQAAVPTNQPATARPKLEGDTNNDGVVDLQEAHAMLAGISTLIQDGLRDGTFTPNDPRYNHVLAKRKQYEDMITGEFKRKDLERKSRERKV